MCVHVTNACTCRSHSLSLYISKWMSLKFWWAKYIAYMDDVQIKKLNIKNLGHFKECRVKMNTYTACDNHMNITCPLNIQYVCIQWCIHRRLIYSYTIYVVWSIRKFEQMATSLVHSLMNHLIVNAPWPEKRRRVLWNKYVWMLNFVNN